MDGHVGERFERLGFERYVSHSPPPGGGLPEHGDGLPETVHRLEAFELHGSLEHLEPSATRSIVGGRWTKRDDLQQGTSVEMPPASYLCGSGSLNALGRRTVSAAYTSMT